MDQAAFAVPGLCCLPKSPHWVKMRRAIPDRMVATPPPMKHPMFPRPMRTVTSASFPATELLKASTSPAETVLIRRVRPEIAVRPLICMSFKAALTKTTRIKSFLIEK